MPLKSPKLSLLKRARMRSPMSFRGMDPAQPLGWCSECHLFASGQARKQVPASALQGESFAVGHTSGDCMRDDALTNAAQP